MWVILAIIFIFIILILWQNNYPDPTFHYTVLSPGAIVLIQRGNQLIYNKAQGLSDIFNEKVIRVDDQMRIASITKTMTATIIYQLVSENRLSLNDEARTYLNQIPAGITIEHLARMTSGLFNYTDDPSFENEFMLNPYHIFSPIELISYALKHPVLFPPGQGWYYSNTNYIILGLIIEQLTGQSLNQVFQERIFIPLGMSRTYLPAPEDNSLTPPYSNGYSYNKIIGTDVKPLVSVTNYNPSTGWAAGGVVSTAQDLLKYVRPFVTGQLARLAVGKDGISPAFSPYTEIGSIKYGLGIAQITGYYGHNGSTPGYQSFMGYLPSNQTSVIILTNLDSTIDGKKPADIIATQLLPQLV